MENRKFLKTFFSVALWSTILLITSSCYSSQWILFHDKEIRGYVVDDDTKQPIENAIVVAMWQLSQIASEGFGGYAKVIEIKTDKEGKVIIPSWTTFKPWTANSVMHEFAPKVIIYKPGYKVYVSHRVLWEGYPNDRSISEDMKMKLKTEYSISPTKLKKLRTDEEIWDSYIEFRSEASFYGSYYSSEQFKEILSLIKQGVLQLADENKISKKKILDHIGQFEK